MDFNGIVDALLIQKLMEHGLGGTQVSLLVDYPALADCPLPSPGLGVELYPVGARVIVIALVPALPLDDFSGKGLFSIHAFHNTRIVTNLQG